MSAKRYMLLNEIGESWNRWHNKWVPRETSETTVYGAKSHIGNDLFVAQTKAVRVTLVELAPKPSLFRGRTCTVCGKSVTTNALGRNSHIAKHVREALSTPRSVRDDHD